MKTLIRKLKLKKSDSKYINELNQYVVIYKDTRYIGVCCYDIMSEESLKEELLNPTHEIRFIFKYEDKLDIKTEFEELKEDE